MKTVNKLPIFIFLIFISGCYTVTRFDRNISKLENHNLRNNTAVITFIKETGKSGGEEGGKIPMMLSVFTLNLFPIPLDWTTITAPDIWDDYSDEIDDDMDTDLSSYILNKIGERGNIDWKKEFNESEITLDRIIHTCREKNIKYLYLIRYNEYTDVAFMTGYSYSGNYSTTTYEKLSGSILMASRILIDVNTMEVLLDRRRIGEFYWWHLPFMNGWGQGSSSFTAHYVSHEVEEYVRDVGMRDYPLAKKQLSEYLLKKDLFETK